MTYKEIAYACLDLLKIVSDDSYITIDHVLFLASKVRALILKQKYSDIRKEIPESNYLTISLDLMEVPAIPEHPCEGGSYLRSIEKIPTAMSIGSTRIYPIDFYQGEITYVSRERMRYVGNNKWLSNIIYASIAPDLYLYFKSCNPLYLYLLKVQMSAVFEDPEKASELSDVEQECDILDKRFPLEEGLVSMVIEIIVKYLSGVAYRPKDDHNNARDDLSDIMSFIRKNMKSNMQKKLEDDD